MVAGIVAVTRAIAGGVVGGNRYEERNVVRELCGALTRKSATLRRELLADGTEVWAYSEIDARDGSVVVYDVDAAGRVASTRPPLPLFERFRGLNDAADSFGLDRVWTAVTFALEANSKFNVDFGYGAVPVEEEQRGVRLGKLEICPLSSELPLQVSSASLTFKRWCSAESDRRAAPS